MTGRWSSSLPGIGISAQRTAWLATGAPEAVQVKEDSVERAAGVLREFAKAWLPQVQPGGSADPRQDEHALESRILRGLVPIQATDGAVLTHLRPPPHVHVDGPDSLVNWGSQFPTRSGRTQAPGGRYLDALLRDGATPWALEIKVEGSGGLGQYYRHAVGQAVLYPQFIRTATPLKDWFERYELNQAGCEAAVVVPEFTPPQAGWAARPQRGLPSLRRRPDPCAPPLRRASRHPPVTTPEAGHPNTASDPFDLRRFTSAQDSGGTYATALGELQDGRKRSHWMWFVFPQIAGLGRSQTAQRYAIFGWPRRRPTCRTRCSDTGSPNALGP